MKGGNGASETSGITQFAVRRTETLESTNTIDITNR